MGKIFEAQIGYNNIDMYSEREKYGNESCENEHGRYSLP